MLEDDSVTSRSALLGSSSSSLLLGLAAVGFPVTGTDRDPPGTGSGGLAGLPVSAPVASGAARSELVSAPLEPGTAGGPLGPGGLAGLLVSAPLGPFPGRREFVGLLVSVSSEPGPDTGTTGTGRDPPVTASGGLGALDSAPFEPDSGRGAVGRLVIDSMMMGMIELVAAVWIEEGVVVEVVVGVVVVVVVGAIVGVGLTVTRWGVAAVETGAGVSAAVDGTVAGLGVLMTGGFVSEEICMLQLEDVQPQSQWQISN